MNKKQFLWLAAALCLLALTGCLGVSVNRRAETQAQELAAQTQELLGSFGGSVSVSPATPYVAKLNVEGTIMASATTTSYLSGASFDLAATEAYIDRLMADEYNVGMLLYVNSPGGEMAASDKLYYKLMDYRATGRPIYCYFDEMACSGGYYVAMPADEIYADRNCLCVNIGVYISTYNFAQLFEKYGVEQVNFKSSENKGIGMTGVPWTDEQKAIYQSIVDLYYEQFLEVVAEGRDMTKAKVRRQNDGREMLAAQALEAGFIDGICRYEEYEEQVLARFKSAVLYEETWTPGVWEGLLGSLESLVPRSESEVWQEFADAHSGMTVMAYDKQY